MRHCTPKIVPYFDAGMIVSTGEIKLSDVLFYQADRDTYDAECVGIGNGMSTARLVDAPSWVTIDTAEYKLKVAVVDIAANAGSYPIKIVYDESGHLFVDIILHVYQCSPKIDESPKTMTTGNSLAVPLYKEAEWVTVCAGYLPFVVGGEPESIRAIVDNELVFTIPADETYAG